MMMAESPQPVLVLSEQDVILAILHGLVANGNLSKSVGKDMYRVVFRPDELSVEIYLLEPGELSPFQSDIIPGETCDERSHV